MICRFAQDFCTKNVNLFRLSVETPTSKVLVYDLLAILEKQDAEQLQVFKAKCDKAVIAESKAVQEMEVKSLEAEKVRLEEKKTARQNAGLDDDSGMWQYCAGNYPILVSEGTCEAFYSKFGLSSSSSAESSSSTSVESSSSEIEFSSSSVSSSSVIESSSSDAMSSSSENASSSSSKPVSSSSSKANSSSSDGTPIIWKTVQPSFHLAVEGMTVTLSNAQGGVVRIFDALGHLVAASKPLAGATTSITLQTPGNYIVRVNGTSRMATLK